MATHPDTYKQYGITDFFQDERFIKYALQKDAAEEQYWKEVAEKYPAKQAAMDEARQWILLLNRQPVYSAAKPKEQLWQQLQQKMVAEDKRTAKVKVLRKTIAWVSSIAASIMLVLALQEWQQHGEQLVKADYGRLEELTLPDETVVTLNGNSSIHYNRTWATDKPREIWLQGEAFFKVKHVAIKNRLLQSDSFRVHLNQLDLTVTGTQFNVKQRRNTIEITLLEGSLRVNKTADGSLVNTLKPGDVLVYNNDTATLQQKAGNAQANNAWVRREMDLEGYTLAEILQILEDTYGYDIELKAPEMADKKLTGTIPASNAEDILFVLQKVFKLTISRNGKQLIITNN